MKQVYWIDDDIEQMIYIIQGAITKLWKIEEENAEGIASNIIIFGNACDDADTDELLSQEDENDTKVKLHDMLRRLCARQDGPNQKKPVYNARKELIKDKVNFLYKKENPGDKEQYQNLKRAWITDELIETESIEYKEAVDEVNKLIERMNIEQGSVVGIDILLFYGDDKRVEDKKRIISMELYNMLSKKGLNCFMYSSMADDNELMRNWREVCDSLYQQKDMKIYLRSDFMQKAQSDITVEIEAMFLTDGMKGER